MGPEVEDEVKDWEEMENVPDQNLSGKD